MRLWVRVVLILELLIGVLPVTAFYLYLFPAGLSWARRVAGLIRHGILNTFTMVIAAVFVLGGIGLASLWTAIARRLAGRGIPGILLAGIFAGAAASVALLGVVTRLGAYWVDWFLYGTPLLVAAHQIRFAWRPGVRPRGPATAGRTGG